jgi:hypothetical protein
MEDGILALQAVEQIKALKARYFRCMDCKDWAGLRNVFTDDVITDFRESVSPSNEALLIKGADKYLENLVPILQTIVTVHHGHMPEIVLQSATAATGVWAMEDKLWVVDGSMPWKHLHGYGHYHETYRRQADGWRICEIRLTRLHLEAA